MSEMEINKGESSSLHSDGLMAVPRNFFEYIGPAATDANSHEMSHK